MPNICHKLSLFISTGLTLVRHTTHLPDMRSIFLCVFSVLVPFHLRLSSLPFLPFLSPSLTTTPPALAGCLRAYVEWEILFEQTNSVGHSVCPTGGTISLKGCAPNLALQAYNGLLGFRIDGAMHWASCHRNRFSVDADGKLQITPSECMQRLAKEKTNGEIPKFTYNSATNQLTAEVETGFPVLKSVTLEFDAAHCAKMMENVDVALPSHAEL